MSRITFKSGTAIAVSAEKGSAAYDTHTHTHTHTFNGPLPGTTWVSRYQKGKTNLDLLNQETVSGSGIICTLIQTNNHASTPPLSFLQARCPSCRPTNSVKALMA